MEHRQLPMAQKVAQALLMGTLQLLGETAVQEQEKVEMAAPAAVEVAAIITLAVMAAAALTAAVEVEEMGIYTIRIHRQVPAEQGALTVEEAEHQAILHRRPEELMVGAARAKE